MPYNLILNSSNVVNSTNTTFLFKFINGAFYIPEGSEICVSQIVFPYSWFNINAGAYTNSTFQYKWYGSANTATTYTVTLPNGYYATSDINNYLEQYFISQNQYLINASGQNVYYISLNTNIAYYSNQILTFTVPTSLPAGWTAPSGGFNVNSTNTGNQGYSTTGYTPQVVITSYTGIYGFGSVIGFIAGTYPPSATATSYNVLSNTTPLATNVNSVVVRCDKVSNPCSMPSDILDTFSITSTFGSNIIYTPAYEKWISLVEGQYVGLAITFQDQNFRTIYAQDPNILVSLLVRRGKIPEKTNFLNRPALPFIKQIKFNDEKIEEDV